MKKLVYLCSAPRRVVLVERCVRFTALVLLDNDWLQAFVSPNSDQKHNANATWDHVSHIVFVIVTMHFVVFSTIIE